MKFEEILRNDYSRVPNKRTGLLLENEKKSHLYALIRNYTIINFQQKVPPIRLFPPMFCQIKPMLATIFINLSRILDQSYKQMVSQGWLSLGIPMEHPNIEV